MPILHFTLTPALGGALCLKLLGLLGGLLVSCGGTGRWTAGKKCQQQSCLHSQALISLFVDLVMPENREPYKPHFSVDWIFSNLFWSRFHILRPQEAAQDTRPLSKSESLCVGTNQVQATRWGRFAVRLSHR